MITGTIGRLLALGSLGLAVAQGPVRAADPVYTNPLGIAMEEYPYPFPVHLLPLQIEGQDLRMAYMDVPPTGASNGRAVVLLHGKNFYGSYWEGPARALAAAGFRVIIPDQIGFGRSSKPDIHYSFDLLATNTMHLLDILQVSRAVVVGHSMGGMLAVRIARNYPGRVEQLVLEDPIGLEDYRFSIPPQPLEKLVEGELNQTVEAYRDYVKHYVVEWKPEVFEPYVETRARMALSGEFPRWARAAALTYLMIYQQPVRHEFKLITVPTLLVIGQADRTVVGGAYAAPEVRKTLGNYPVLGRQAAEEIPGAKLVEIPNAGHIPHLERPDQFLTALMGYVRREDTGERRGTAGAP